MLNNVSKEQLIFLICKIELRVTTVVRLATNKLLELLNLYYRDKNVYKSSQEIKKNTQEIVISIGLLQGGRLRGNVFINFMNITGRLKNQIEMIFSKEIIN